MRGRALCTPLIARSPPKFCGGRRSNYEDCDYDREQNEKGIPDKSGQRVISVLFIIIFVFGFYYPGWCIGPQNKDEIVNQTLNEIQKNIRRAEIEGRGKQAIEAYRQRPQQLLSKEEKEAEVLQEIETLARIMPSRGVKTKSGKVGLTEWDTEYNYKFNAFGEFPVELGVGTQYVSINNSAELELPAHLTGFIAGMNITLPFLDFAKAHFRLQLTPAFYSSNWSFGPSRFRMPIKNFLIYQPDNKRTFICGIAVFPRYRNKVIPIAGFIYKPDDKWEFNLVPARPNIVYAITERLSAFGGYNIIGDEFEVGKDGREHAILEYNQQCLGLGLEYELNKYISASLSTGATLKSMLRYRDSLGKVVLKNGSYTEFRVNINM